MELIHFVEPDIVHLNSLVLAPSAVGVKRPGVRMVWHIRESVHPGHLGLEGFLFQPVALERLPHWRHVLVFERDYPHEPVHAVGERRSLVELSPVAAAVIVAAPPFEVVKGASQHEAPPPGSTCLSGHQPHPSHNRRCLHLQEIDGQDIDNFYLPRSTECQSEGK